MGKSKHKEYNKEDKDGEIGKLKKRVRHLEKENDRLKSELRTYESAFNKSVKFLKEKTENFSLDEMIKGAQQEMTLQEIKRDKAQRFEDFKNKWQCKMCSDGVLHMFIIPGNRYFRKCNMCENRTPVKELTEDVDRGIE